MQLIGQFGTLPYVVRRFVRWCFGEEVSLTSDTLVRCRARVTPSTVCTTTVDTLNYSVTVHHILWHPVRNDFDVWCQLSATEEVDRLTETPQWETK